MSDYFEREKEEARKRQRKNARYLCTIFLVLIIILALLGSSQIVLVILLYASIIFEALSLSILIANGVPLWDLLFMRERAKSMTTFRGGNDAVSSLHIYVKYAARGSAYSKREVALLLRSIFQNSPPKEDSQFESDLNLVYYSYIRDSNKPEPVTKRASRGERDAYLASLQRVMKKIREDSVPRRNY